MHIRTFRQFKGKKAQCLQLAPFTDYSFINHGNSIPASKYLLEYLLYNAKVLVENNTLLCFLIPVKLP